MSSLIICVNCWRIDCIVLFYSVQFIHKQVAGTGTGAPKLYQHTLVPKCTKFRKKRPSEKKTENVREDSDERTKRLELLLRSVLALPNASSSGFDCRMMSFTRCNHIVTTSKSDVTHSHITDVASHNLWDGKGVWGAKNNFGQLLTLLCTP